MPNAVRTGLILLILLVPSAQFAWRDRTMLDFGSLHDDGVLFVTGKSVAQNSYRIPSLPEQPAQTKFPPLYPLYLSIVWRINPHFPANLELATLLSWIALAACLVLARRLYQVNGLSEARVWLLTALLAVNPYMILFGTRMFSEIFFTCFLLATLLAISRSGLRMAALAGLLAGCAYLSRTAGIALLISVPAVLIWKKRQWRSAAVFAAAMLPAVIGWSLWTRANMFPAPDQTLLYYTDYVRYQFLNVGMSNLSVVVWKNIDQILYGIGSLVMPKVADFLPLKILTQVIAIAMIAGVVRLARRGILVSYAAFAAVSTGMLLIWHFPPNERFVLPLYPLLVAGLVEELEHLGRMMRSAVRHRDLSQRIVAGIFAIAALAIFGAAAALQGFVTFVFLHQTAQEKAAKLHDLKDAYHWIETALPGIETALPGIETALPASANILSYDDPLLYLYTGHRGNYLPLLPRWWYAEDHEAMIGAYRGVADYCRERGLSYVLFTSQDLAREVGEDDRQAIEKAVRENPRLTPVFQSGIATVYKLRE